MNFSFFHFLPYKLFIDFSKSVLKSIVAVKNDLGAALL